MAAKSPEQICELFQRHARAGDLEEPLSRYDVEAVFLNQARETKHGHEEMRSELARLAAANARFEPKFDPTLTFLRYNSATPQHFARRP